MSDLYKTTVYFNNSAPLMILLSQEHADILSTAVVNQQTALNIRALNFMTGKETDVFHIFNGRFIERVEAEKFVPQKS